MWHICYIFLGFGRGLPGVRAVYALTHPHPHPASAAPPSAPALDFHIAYYVGALSREAPSAFLHIISKDAGFDPLIKHLRARKLLVQRSTRIAEIPCLKPPLPTAMDAQIDAVVTDLVRRKAAKPRTQKTLLSTLNALFKKELSEGQLTQLFAALREPGIVQVEGTKVAYPLPAA